MRHIFLFIAAMLATLPATAQVYERLSARAADHYTHAEWDEAISVTDRMVRIHPEDVHPYSMALVAAHFTGDTTTQSRYLVLSQRYGVPIDTLLTDVYRRAQELNDTGIYETILLSLKAGNRWLAKVFNHYLLDYYAFARRPERTIAIADELLAVTPHNLRYTKIKANALFYQGDTDAAVSLYQEILTEHPADYDALTFLAAYYSVRAEERLDSIDSLYLSEAQPDDSVYSRCKQGVIDSDVRYSLSLMRKAYDMRQSEYLEQQIGILEALTPCLPDHPSKRKSLILRLKNRLEVLSKEPVKE